MTCRILTASLFVASLTAMPALAIESPYIQPDGSWISLSGTVTNIRTDGFTLDYGPDEVDIEVDDWDWYDDSAPTIEGDNVTVYGEVDDDTYETASVEASSIYVEELGTYYYASPADEETFTDVDLAPTTPIVVGDFTLTGTITSVENREFTLASGVREVRVDTSTMSYNPMDEEGLQQLGEGDLVTVSGTLDDDFFESQEVIADTVLILSENP